LKKRRSISTPFFSPGTVSITGNEDNNCAIASITRKRKFDPSLCGRKVDFTVNLSAQKKEALLVAEVKPPKHRNNNYVQNDLTKLGNEMKDALDQMIDDNILRKEVVCGLLVKGN
jgi:hypothetical protein